MQVALAEAQVKLDWHEKPELPRHVLVLAEQVWEVLPLQELALPHVGLLAVQVDWAQVEVPSQVFELVQVGMFAPAPEQVSRPLQVEESVQVELVPLQVFAALHVASWSQVALFDAAQVTPPA